MNLRQLGRTGLQVAPVGLGAVELGVLPIEEAACESLLRGALDAGANLIDTAECYGSSEERIGRALEGRRNEAVLVTKCGHRIEPDDPAEWTPELLEVNITRSLRRLRCEAVDVLLLHSCEPAVLRAGAIVEKLLEIRRRGLARFIGYSGDAAKLDAALELECFDVLELSVNLCDQRPLETHLPQAAARGIGVLAKRPMANACWRAEAEQEGYLADYARPYATRLNRMKITPEGLGFDGEWPELAIRFAANAPGVGAAIVGTRRLENLRQGLEWARRGPLPESVQERLRTAWNTAQDATWEGQN